MENSYGISSLRVAGISVMFSLMSACSSLQGTRFVDVAPTDSAQLAGVPFTLNRPVPTVVRSKGADGTPDKYEISFDYVPDPAARFTLQIDPVLLSSIDFNMAFDAKGSITDTSAKTTDQTGPMIVSLGKLAATMSALDKTTADDEELIKLLEAAGNQYLNKPGSTIPDPANEVPRPVNAADRAAWTDLFKRMKDEAATSPIRKDFVYLSSHEYLLLQALLAERRRDAKTAAAAKAAAPESVESTAFKNKADEIQQARLRLDKRALAKIRKELVDKRRTLRASHAMDPDNADGANALKENFELLGLAKPKLEGIDDLLVDIADLSETEWQRRLVAHLNKRIEARRHLMRIHSASFTAKDRRKELNDAELNTLLYRKAVALGVGAQRQRRLELSRALERARLPRHLQVLREEITALEAAEVSAENALKSAAKENPAADAPARATLLTASHGIVVDSVWIRKALSGRPLPPYVIVAQPVAVTADAVPAPNPPTPGAAPGQLPPPPATPDVAPKFPLDVPASNAQPKG